MAGGRRQAHFHDQATTNALKGVPLPDKIRCGRCNKYRAHAQFSNKQLMDARYAVKNQGHNARYKINCQLCIGHQVVEIECCMCHKTKGLEGFAKSQRKKPDSAKCFACIDDQLSQEPIQEEIYESDDRSRAFLPADTSAGAMPSVWTDATASNKSEAGDSWDNTKSEYDADDGGINLSHEFSRKASMMSDIDHETLIETENAHTSQMSSNNEWQLVQSADSWHTKSSKTPSTASGFNPNKYGNPVAGSTNVSGSGSVHSFSSGFAERSDTVSKKGGFAKIKAYDPKKDPDNKSLQNPAKNGWDSSPESESEDDDYEKDSDDDDTEI